MTSALGDDGLQCFGSPVSQNCLKAFIKYAAEKICQAVQEAEPDSKDAADAETALTAVFNIQELFDNLSVQFTTTNESGHKEINKDKVMTRIQHTCRAFKLSSTYHGQQKLQISFAEEQVTKKVHVVMDAISKATGLPLDRLYGPAPPGQADDKLSKWLQALQIQDEGKRGGKKKKKTAGRKAPTKDEPPTQADSSQTSWGSGQWK